MSRFRFGQSPEPSPCIFPSRHLLSLEPRLYYPAMSFVELLIDRFSSGFLAKVLYASLVFTILATGEVLEFTDFFFVNVISRLTVVPLLPSFVNSVPCIRAVF